MQFNRANIEKESGIEYVPANDDVEVYGFRWGNTIVQRTTEFNGTKVLTIKAGKNEITVCISPTGKAIRVFNKASKEMKA